MSTATAFTAFMVRALAFWPRQGGLAGTVLLICTLGLSLPACQPGDASSGTASAHKAPTSTASKTEFKGTALYTGPHRTPKNLPGLLLVAYNYSDTAISSFSINGAGGGNVEVSDTGDGYGGGTCCSSVPADLPLPLTVEVSWQRDYGMPRCKQTVLLDGPIPDNADTFEVHFYQDGSIQVAVTHRPSVPRLKLDRFNRIQRKATDNVNNDSVYSGCAHG
jgi:hypothetical protein